MKFRKKPIVIEAIRWEGDNTDEFDDFAPEAKIKCEGMRNALVIETLEGTMLAEPGDWIIRGIANELYPCKPEIFAATYEPVEYPSSPQVMPSQWISVKTRVPDEETGLVYVAATRENGECMDGESFWTEEYGWNDLEDQGFMTPPVITHWMPKPKLPVGSEVKPRTTQQFYHVFVFKSKYSSHQQCANCDLSDVYVNAFGIPCEAIKGVGTGDKS